jgi:D-alanyl-D-alanine carboxypeptidase/D-alanyl-D-alanine-endopeptidase (penicillin-binding protein 4)
MNDRSPVARPHSMYDPKGLAAPFLARPLQCNASCQLECLRRRTISASSKRFLRNPIRLRGVGNRATVAVVVITLLSGASAFQASSTTMPAGAQARSGGAAQGSIYDSADALRARILAHISQPRFKSAAWGIKVVCLSNGVTVFEHNAAKYFTPASNAKLFTAALALDSLGPGYRIKTSLYAARRPGPDGTLRGDLIVYGRGDPTISATFNSGDYYAGLEPLAAALRSAGVRRIRGNLIGDESYFKGAPFGSGWGWDDLQWYYGAEVSALSIDDNSLDLSIKAAGREGAACSIELGPSTGLVTIVNRTVTGGRASKRNLSIYRPVAENVIYVSGCLPVGDSGYTGHIAVHRPAELFVSMFKEVLRRHGIAVSGGTKTVDWLYRQAVPFDASRAVELGSIASRPLAEIVREMLKSSQNLYAQLLLLQVGANRVANSSRPLSVGAKATPKPETSSQSNPDQEQPDFSTTEQNGLQQLKAFFEKVGLDPGTALLEEGAGLSRRDQVTPASIVTLLAVMNRHPCAAEFADALPVAGIDGSLTNRMIGTVAAGNVRAKTGTLRYANALSGYVTTGSGELLAFSVLLNNYTPVEQSSPARDEVDAVAAMLAAFTGRVGNR